MAQTLPADRKLTVLGHEAVIKTPYDPVLVDAIRAIPGRAFDPRSKAWRVSLAHDRAASLLRLREHFGLDTEPDQLAVLERAAAKTKGRYELELIMPAKGVPPCVSLCDAWDDPELMGLVEQFDHFLHPEVGRISVELDAKSARALYAIHEHRPDILWTVKLEEQVDIYRRREIHAPRPPAAIAEALEGKQLTVRFTNGRTQLYITTSQPEEVIARIPGSEDDGFQVVVTPAERLTAVGLSELQRDGYDLEMSPTVRAWMEGELHWDSHVTALKLDGVPSFQVTGEDEAHPHCLDAAPAEALDEETWRLPLTEPGAGVVLELLDANPHLEIDHKARRCLERLEERPDDVVPPGVLSFEEGRDGGTAFRLTVFWGDEAAEAFTALPGATRLAGSLTRAADELAIADAWNATALRDFTKQYAIEVDEETDALLLRLIDEHDRAEEIVEMSRATSGTLDLGIPGAELMPFQIAGIEYALDRRRTFIADEQGLGKTVQALFTIEAADAFPVVVLTPASLKLNWERESHRWLPHRSTCVISGRGKQQSIDGDILILNYEVVEAHREALAALHPGALILDESHYCKSPTAKRTKSVQALADALDETALRLALTGTPLVNRPKELVSQLRILGRLTEFGSGAGFERRFGSVEERERLHWHLRRTCYLRRLKRDVLPQLPDKQRAVVPVELSNDQEYRRAEKAFMDWLTDQFSGSDQLDQKLTAAVRGKALVKIGTLRKLAGKGKVATSVSWIDDFLASGEKLVVFAQHVDVQHALADHFPDAVHILGSDGPAERDAAVQRFQNDPETLLCVCSLRVAAHGLTLTAAANVAFVELGWTPAEHDQAEDRCHRIGQEDSVTAWYLLAANTIDDRIAALIESKRAIVGSVTDGGAGADLPAIDAILADYLTAVDAPEAAIDAVAEAAVREPYDTAAALEQSEPVSAA